MKRNPAYELFRTPVEVGTPLRPIGLQDKNVMLGSCFAEHVGKRMQEAQLATVVNPLGVLYNPLSIAQTIGRALRGAQHAEQQEEENTFSFTLPSDFREHQGMWHAWLGDTSLSATTVERCRDNVHQALSTLQQALTEADNLFLTMGTSRAYRLQETGCCVANCHRVPQCEFQEVELSVEEMTQQLDEVLSDVHELNPKVQVVFTVSPYRYAKYGMHGSQVSKARLLLTAEALQNAHPRWVTYFPAYELLMDELRDYRFYATDMLHPSEQAVDYIWRRLCESWATPELQNYLAHWESLQKALLHRPNNPADPANEELRKQTIEKMKQLKK